MKVSYSHIFLIEKIHVIIISSLGICGTRSIVQFFITSGWVIFIHPKFEKAFKLELQAEYCEGEV